MKRSITYLAYLMLCTHPIYPMTQVSSETIIFDHKKINDSAVLSSLKVFGKEIVQAHYWLKCLKSSGITIDNVALIVNFKAIPPFDFDNRHLNKEAYEKLIMLSQRFIEHLCTQAFTVYGKECIIVQLPTEGNAQKTSHVNFFEKIGFTNHGNHEVNGILSTYLDLQRRNYNPASDPHWHWKQYLNSDVVGCRSKDDYYDPRQIPLSTIKEQ